MVNIQVENQIFYSNNYKSNGWNYFLRIMNVLLTLITLLLIHLKWTKREQFLDNDTYLNAKAYSICYKKRKQKKMNMCINVDVYI